MAQCNMCGEDRSVVLEQHHKIPRSRDGSDKDSNLVTLCANCHRTIESIYDDEFWEEVADSNVSLHPDIEILDGSQLDAEAEELW